VPGPFPAGRLPTDGDTPVIRRTTTRPVRNIKGQRPAYRYSTFLGHVSHINWQNRVAHLLSDHNAPGPGRQLEYLDVLGTDLSGWARRDRCPCVWVHARHVAAQPLPTPRAGYDLIRGRSGMHDARAEVLSIYGTCDQVRRITSS
jgi:hypothetical protein